MRYNSSNFSGKRFRYYKSSTYTQQKAIQLYKKVGSGTVTPTYTITFNANGGTGTMEPQVVNDAEANAMLARPERAPYGAQRAYDRLKKEKKA